MAAVTAADFAVPQQPGQTRKRPIERVLELALPLAALGVANGGALRFQISIWKDGLPVDAIPQQGLIGSLDRPSRWSGLCRPQASPDCLSSSRV